MNKNTTTSAIRELVFDEALVNHMKALKVDEDLLYARLISGRITLQEYIAASARA